MADIFVRINSEGVRLNQADFILTLMSVFWDEGRMALETFCRQSRPGTVARQVRLRLSITSSNPTPTNFCAWRWRLAFNAGG